MIRAVVDCGVIEGACCLTDGSCVESACLTYAHDPNFPSTAPDFYIGYSAAFLDIVSGGRLELGLARSGGTEWDTFGVDPERSRDELRDILGRCVARSGLRDAYVEIDESWIEPLINRYLGALDVAIRTAR